MANPLAMFRKYEKVLLVIFGVALMFVFTVGGIVSDYMYRDRTATQDNVVVNIKNEELRESDLQNLVNTRQFLVSFMGIVAQAAAEKGATPQQGLGISDSDAEADLLQTSILAEQAEQLGIEVSDEAIINFLTHFSQDKLELGDFARILNNLNNVSPVRMSQTQLFDAMRRELMAQRFITVFQRGILPPTPEGTWDYFQRLNRRISFEAVPFEVADYLGRVGQEPTEPAIVAMYEEGKNRYPLPYSPEPGFKQLKRIALQYVKADLSTFVSEAKGTITDEQVRQYYEAHREEFRNIALPASENPTSPDSDPPAATPDANAVPAADPNASDSPAADGSTETTPPAAGDPPAQQDAPAAVQADGPADEVLDVEVSEKAVEDAAVSDPLNEPPPDDPIQEPDPLADLPEAAGNNAPDARPEFKPLEEVADEIRTRLAKPIAQQKMEQALNAVRSQMRGYFSNYLAWAEPQDQPTTAQPPPPDLRQLASQYGLTYGSIPLVNIFQLQQTDPVSGEPLYEISRAYDTDFRPFAQYVFSDDFRLYEVRSIRGQVLDTEYLYWKTAEVGQSVPQLEDVRDQVVRALKMKQALELAKHDAEELATQLNATHQLPHDVLANDPNRKVIDADSVTWMTSMSVPYLPPRVSQLPGIEYPGDKFMKSVFSLSPGLASTAVDDPQDTVYAVAVTRVDSDEQQLRDQFLRAGMTPEIAMLAQRDSQIQLQDWYAALEKDLGIKWQREPRPATRGR